MALEVVFSIVGKIGECSIEPIGRQLGYLVHYKKNVKKLEDEAGKLEKVRMRIQKKIDAAKTNGELIEDDVDEWLKKVRDSTQEVEELLKDNDKSCFKGWCPDIWSRYRLGKEAKKKAEDVFGLQQDGKFETAVSYPAPPSDIGSTSTADYEAFGSRTSVFEEIMETLKDDKVNIIGIYGMAGVGKTTMAKEVGKQVKRNKLFDEVVIVAVSQNPNVRKIQGELADFLSMKLNQETERGRADRLCKRLKNGNRILVILDDVWNDLDLEEIGIPLRNNNIGCKILLTSREESVWPMMDIQNKFSVGVLLEREAWDLFKKTVGNSLDTSEMLSLAEEVCKGCRGLPKTIVTVGAILKNKDKSVWSDVLAQLKKSALENIEGMDAKVYSKQVRADTVIVVNGNFNPQSHPPGLRSIQSPVFDYIADDGRRLPLTISICQYDVGPQREKQQVSIDSATTDRYANNMANSENYIDAAFRSSQTNEAYLFMKNEYLLLNYAPGTNDDRVLDGPLLIRDGFPSLKGTAFAEHGIDCAFGSALASEAFIFSGNLCAMINYTPHTSNGWITNGPMTIITMFPFLKGTVFESGVDAAFESTKEPKAYLFKGNQYALINYGPDDFQLIGHGLISQGFPSFRSTVFESGIDAAFASHRYNEAYIFKGDSYQVINFALATTDDYFIGGMKKILDFWPSLCSILPRKYDAGSQREKQQVSINSAMTDRYANNMANSESYIDAAFRSSQTNEAYLFVKNEYLLLNYAPGTNDDRVLDGPLLIRDGYPSLRGTSFAEHRIDCAFGSALASEAFIFSGNLCAMINYTPHTSNGWIKNGPMTIIAMFPFLKGTVFESGVDAAFESTKEPEAYLFKGNQYALINYGPDDCQLIGHGLITQGFPSFRSTIFESGIDAAFASHRYNEAYIFKGDSYQVINFALATTDDYFIGGMKKILDFWPSLCSVLPRKNCRQS